MRLIDADELMGRIEQSKNCFFNTTDKEIALNYIYQAPTIDQWHYPSKGELPDKDWTKHPLNVSKKCFVLTKRGVGLIAIWDNDYKTWFENQPHLPVPDVIAWQYFVPPKEEA